MAIEDERASLEAHYKGIPSDNGRVIGVEVLQGYTPLAGGAPRDVLRVVLNLNALPWAKYCPEAKPGVGWNGVDVAAYQRGQPVADSVLPP